jgi:Protein of unknown function (DUF2490)
MNKLIKHTFIFLFFASLPINIFAQKSENTLGGWYQYLWNTSLGKGQFRIIGDLQHRNYGVFSDFQQWIIRGAVAYDFKGIPLKVAMGYGYFNSGTLGKSNEQFHENRIYQDILFSQKISTKIYLGHRLRIEQRFVQGLAYRTRYRYLLSARVPLNQKTLTKNAIYAVGWSEIFLNGQKDFFDRNWTLGGFGYIISSNLKYEMGYMRETTNTNNKGQLIFTLFQGL